MGEPMKLRVLTALAVLAVGTTGCTPEEIQFWIDLENDHPAEAAPAEPAPIQADTAVAEQEAVRETFEPAADEGPCLVKYPVSIELTFQHVGPNLVAWHVQGTGALFGYSMFEDSRIYQTADCVERSPAY